MVSICPPDGNVVGWVVGPVDGGWVLSQIWVVG